MFKLFISPLLRQKALSFSLLKPYSPMIYTLHLSSFSSQQVPSSNKPDIIKSNPLKQQIEDPDYPEYPSDYNYNIRQLEEVAKIYRLQVQHLTVTKALNILKVFAMHKYMRDDNFYELFEKSILKHIHAISREDFVRGLTYLSMLQRGRSEKFVLMVEHKTYKILQKLTPSQFVELLKSLSKIDRGSSKFFRIMHGYFVQKAKSFTTPQIIEISHYLIISRKLTKIQFDELYYHLCTRLQSDLHSLHIDDILRVLDLTLIQRQEADFRVKSADSDRDYDGVKDKIFSTINGIPLPQVTQQTEKVVKNQYELAKLLPEVIQTVEVYLEDHKMALKQLRLIVEKLRELDEAVPEIAFKEIVRLVEVEARTMDPGEFKKVYMVLRGVDFDKDIKSRLDGIFNVYFNHFFEDMNDSEVAEAWSLMDLNDISGAKEMQERIEKRIILRINSLLLPDLINYTHLRIKTKNLLENPSSEQPDSLLYDHLLPKTVALLKRGGSAEDTVVVAKWLTVLPNVEVKLLQDFIGILKNVEVKTALEYFYIVKFLDFVKEKKDELYGLCQSTLLMLEDKYKSSELQKIKNETGST